MNEVEKNVMPLLNEIFQRRRDVYAQNYELKNYLTSAYKAVQKSMMRPIQFLELHEIRYPLEQAHYTKIQAFLVFLIRTASRKQLLKLERILLDMRDKMLAVDQ